MDWKGHMWETGGKGRGDPFSGKEAATLSGKVRCNESALSESISLSSEENTHKVIGIQHLT